MKSKFRNIFFSNAMHYSKKISISYLGALLKSSLIPLELCDRYIPNQAKIVDMGCGEGMFSNSLARLLPQSEIYGVDLDAKKIRQAQSCKLPNVSFQEGAAEQFSFKGADVVIFNDILHHNSYKKQEVLVSHASAIMARGGLLILKEVDSEDRVDKLLTKFFDAKLYPDDPLNFRDVKSWITLLEAHNFEVLTVEVVKHPWIASRTVLIARKSSPPVCYVAGIEPTTFVGYDNKKSNVFLTGATGFIGHHMSLALIENGLNGEKVNLILLVRNPIRLDQTLKEKAIVIKADLLSLKEFRHWSLFDNIDYVFHFAGEVKLHGDPQILALNNIEGTRCLLDILKGKRLKRFIFASTMGAVDRQPDDPCTESMNEDTLPHPLSAYGKTKLDAEILVKNSGIPYSIVRIPWAFGSRMTSDTHVRNLLERVMRHSLTTRINFSGKVSLIAVEDLVNAFILAAYDSRAVNEIFFVAGYPPISLGELYRKMAFLLGGPISLLPVPCYLQKFAQKIRRFLPLTIQNLNSDVLCVDSRKIEKIGFKPKKNLDVSLLNLSAWVHQQYNPKKRTVIVTGAASGIGLELSKVLVATGKHVVLVDKNMGKLAQVAKKLNMPFLNIDLASSKDLEYLLHFIDHEQELYSLVNCAGIGRKDTLLNLPLDKIDELIGVNILSVVKLSKGALEAFCKKGGGVLVNISSSASLQPLPYFSVYAASKAFVSAFTESICYEHRNDVNLKILNIVPSGTDTGFQISAGVQKDPKEKLLSPKYVANRIANFIEKNSSSGTYFIGNRGKIMSLMTRILPRKFNLKIWGYLVGKKR